VLQISILESLNVEGVHLLWVAFLAYGCLLALIYVGPFREIWILLVMFASFKLFSLLIFYANVDGDTTTINEMIINFCLK
jgi:membrane protein implicated in regulation of membrane protease activity